MRMKEYLTNVDKYLANVCSIWWIVTIIEWRGVSVAYVTDFLSILSNCTKPYNSMEEGNTLFSIFTGLQVNNNCLSLKFKTLLEHGIVL